MKSNWNPNRRGRPENLKRGKDKGDPPSRKLSHQKVNAYCVYYLTHDESIKAAGLHIGLSLTYVYEFHKKPEVQARLTQLRSSLDDATVKALNQFICTRQFIDENLAPIIADARPHPTRGFSDRIAAARLAAEMAGFTGTGQKQQPIVNANIIQAGVLDSDVYITQIDRQRLGIQDQRSRDIEQKLLGATDSEATEVGTKNKGASKRTE